MKKGNALRAFLDGGSVCRADLYPDPNRGVYDWYADRVRKMGSGRIYSPNMDGTNSELTFENPTDVPQIMKAVLTSGDAGAFNGIFSMAATMSVTTTKNSIVAIGQVPWNVGVGFRTVSAASKTGGIGVADGAALGTGLESTWLEPLPILKEVELVNDYSQELALYNKIADVVTLDQDHMVHEKEFWDSLDQDMHVDGDTLAVNNFESIDRICASSVVATNQSWTVADEDLYGIDRSVSTAFDANGLENSAVNRTLTLALIDQLEQNQQEYWETMDPADRVYITKPDTFTRWSQLEAAKLRFTSDASFVVTLGEGLTTAKGQAGGMKLATFDMMPIVRDQNVVADGIGRIYCVDKSVTKIQWAKPPTFVENNPDTDPHAAGHVYRGVWYGAGEIVCTKPKACGFLGDLS